RRYAAAWRSQFERRLRLAAVFAHLAMRPAAAALLMELARNWPGLLTLGARWGDKTRCAVNAVTIAALAPIRVTAAASSADYGFALPALRGGRKTRNDHNEGKQMTTTLEGLCAILVKDYQLDPDAVTIDAPLEGLGIDSLGVAELMFPVEDQFRIRLSPDSVRLTTVGDMVRHIDELMAMQHGGDAQAGVATLHSSCVR
ncbi:acyl carrier protein, partial [Candidatus Accumulibacter vicinus]